MRFSYQAEKFSAARQALMLPHSQGEHRSIATAFHECSLALHTFDQSQVGEDAQRWLRELEADMEAGGLADPEGEGTWAVKARGFSTDDKIEISHLVNELAHYFDHEFLSN